MVIVHASVLLNAITRNLSGVCYQECVWSSHFEQNVHQKLSSICAQSARRF